VLDKVLVDAAVAAGAGFREEFTVDGLVWHDGRVVSSCGRSICAIFFRKPFGPGSALVGDAGQHMDACTAQGISAAFQDAETLAHAIDRSLAGGEPMDTGGRAVRKDAQCTARSDLRLYLSTGIALAATARDAAAARGGASPP
jgi:flavin-dependent dehydrogenase